MSVRNLLAPNKLNVQCGDLTVAGSFAAASQSAIRGTTAFRGVATVPAAPFITTIPTDQAVDGMCVLLSWYDPPVGDTKIWIVDVTPGVQFRVEVANDIGNVGKRFSWLIVS